jgi:hypothetical protein
MKRLVLHVGLHKTGTSYLQLWLYRNRERLKASGVAYPDFYLKMPNANHHKLADAIKSRGLDLKQAAKELDVASLDNEAVILSSETFSSLFHRGRQDAQEFKEAFSMFFSISIVIYLRRQDEMLESSYAEIVKTGNSRPIEEMMDRPMNWLSRLQFLSSVFGKDQVFARPYLPRDWVDQHLGMDFITTAQLPQPTELENIDRANEAMGRRKTMFLAMIDKSRVPRLSQFIEQVRQTPAIRDDGMKWLLSPAARRSLVAKYTTSNSTMCDAFFDGKFKEYFSSDPGDIDTWTPPEPISLAEVVQFQYEIWTKVARAEASLHSMRTQVTH